MSENNSPQIVLSDLCRECQHEFGIQQNDVENLARSPDSFSSLDDFNGVQSGFSLRRIDEDWSLIGETKRAENNVVQMNVVFKIPNSLVSRANATDALSVLKQFVTEFGSDITVGDITGKFISDRTIIYQNDQDYQKILSGGFPRSGEFIPLINGSNGSVKGKKAIRINYALCIDVGRYRGIIN